MKSTADNLRSAIERLIDGEANRDGISRADVWKKHPDLVDAWRSAPKHEQQILKRSSSAETVAERAVAVVDKAARRLMWRDFGSRRDLSESQLRTEIWKTEEGRALTLISRSKYGRVPWATVEKQIAKDDDWSLARNTLSNGMPVD